MRIWQAGKKDKALHIVDPIANGMGTFLMVGDVAYRMAGEPETTGLYTGKVKIWHGAQVQDIEYEFSST